MTRSITFSILAVVAAAVCWLAWSTTGPTLRGYAVFGKIEGVAVDRRTVAHFLVQGREIYFDANRDGLPQQDERLLERDCRLPVVSPDGQARYYLTGGRLGLSSDSVSDSLPQHVILNVSVHGPGESNELWFEQTGKVVVHADVPQSGIAHFDGPLSVQLAEDSFRLAAAGGPSVNLRVSLGTEAHNDCDVTPADSVGQAGGQNFMGGCQASAELNHFLVVTVPGTLVPTASVAFPSADGDESVTKRYDLDQFC